MERQDKVSVASMQKLPVEHISSHFGCETIRATKVVKYLGSQVESQGSMRAEAQMRFTGAIKAQARYSRVLCAPRSIGLSNKSRLWLTLVRCILLYAAEAHAQPPRDVQTLEKRQNRSTTTHCKIRCSCVSRAHARPPKEA